MLATSVLFRMRQRRPEETRDERECGPDTPCSSQSLPAIPRLVIRAAVLASSGISSVSGMFADPRTLRGNDGKAVETESFLFGQQTLVHTFGTADSCARNCPRPCVVQEVEDLGMPRWICPTKVRLTISFCGYKWTCTSNNLPLSPPSPVSFSQDRT